MTNKIPIVDIFAGPGGLGEGFMSLKNGEGKSIFDIKLSIEKDLNAHNNSKTGSCIILFVVKKKLFFETTILVFSYFCPCYGRILCSKKC